MMLKSLGHSDVVISGASGGLGFALVAALAESSQWRRIYAVSRRATEHAGLQQLLARDPRIRVIDLDPQDAASLQAFCQRLDADAAVLGLLCNATGMLHNGALMPEKRLADCCADDLTALFTANALAPLLLAQALERFFPRLDPALLVNVSARVGSIADNRLGGWYGYRAAKASLNMFTRNLSIELPRRHRGLTCIAYHPGTVETALSAPFQAGVAPEKLFSPAQAASYLLKVLAGLHAESNGRFYAWDGQQVPW